MLIFSGRDVKRCVLRFSAGGIVVIAVYRPAFAQFHSSCVEERESYAAIVSPIVCMGHENLSNRSSCPCCSFAFARLGMQSNR